MAAVLLLAVPRQEVKAGDEIRFNYLKSTNINERSSLSGQCHNDDAGVELTCQFTQVMVRYELDPKDLVQETQKHLSELRAEDVKKFSDELCADVLSKYDEMEKALEENKDVHHTHGIKLIKNFCTNPSMNGILEITRFMAEEKTKTCMVSLFHSDPVKLTRLSENKWVGNVGPQGICSSIYLYTLERDPKHLSLYTWSQVRTYADTSNSFCKDIQINYRLEYSWKGPEVRMNCETIKFGL